MLQNFGFYIESVFSESDGFPDNASRDAFFREAEERFRQAGWDIKEGKLPRECDYAVKEDSRESLYLYPKRFVGIIRPESVPEIESLLTGATTFRLRETWAFEQYADMSKEDYRKYLDSRRGEMEASILEHFKTSRRDRFVTGNPSIRLTRPFRLRRRGAVNYHEENETVEYVRNLIEDMIADGRLTTSETRLGRGIRTTGTPKARTRKNQGNANKRGEGTERKSADELKASQADTALDEYPMPDPSVSPAALTELGCERRDLLPLFADKAREFADDMTVLAALDGGELRGAFSKTEVDKYPPGTLFAVPMREWESTPAFHDALNARMLRQPQRERAFLRHSGDCFAIYQSGAGSDASRVSLEMARREGLSPRSAGYSLVYSAALPENADLKSLEEQFRKRPPRDYNGAAARNTDIIVIKKNGVLEPWYLDKLAYSKMPGLLESVPLTQEYGEPFPDIPLYPHDAQYAQEHDESLRYFASRNANAECSEAVGEALEKRHDGYALESEAAVRDVVETFGYERTMFVLAVTVRAMREDGRMSCENIRWADSFPVPEDNDPATGEDMNRSLAVRNSPGLVNLFVKEARSQYERIRTPPSREAVKGRGTPDKKKNPAR